MKIGDLVKFHSESWLFEDAAAQYKNPGVVIGVVSQNPARCRYQVLWSDRRITTEHPSYLKLLTSS